MFDFLDMVGLKDVLNTVKSKIPTSLPADGGNADTLDNKHADEFAGAIRMVNLTGTTDSLGDLILWDVSENKIPVCIKGPDATRCVTIVGYSGTKYMVNITDITTQNTVVNTEVLLTIYYTEI